MLPEDTLAIQKTKDTQSFYKKYAGRIMAFDFLIKQQKLKNVPTNNSNNGPPRQATGPPRSGAGVGVGMLMVLWIYGFMVFWFYGFIGL